MSAARPPAGARIAARSAQREGTAVRRLRRLALAAAAAAGAAPAWAQYGSGYTYVKMSLAVPWALYFVFLACVLIPFVVMIALAWRSGPRPEPDEPDELGSADARRGPR